MSTVARSLGTSHVGGRPDDDGSIYTPFLSRQALEGIERVALLDRPPVDLNGRIEVTAAVRAVDFLTGGKETVPELLGIPDRQRGLKDSHEHRGVEQDRRIDADLLRVRLDRAAQAIRKISTCRRKVNG